MKQKNYLQRKLAEADRRYKRARSDAARREALEAIQLVQSELEEVWALYDRS